MKERDEARAARPLRPATRERLSYANVMATAAVFIALGGSAWAVAANSVGTEQLKDKAVSAKKIKKNAVRSKHVRKNTVRTQKIRRGAVTLGKLTSDMRPRWAAVDEDGNLVRGRGVVEASKAGVGQYNLTFDRNLTASCSVTANPEASFLNVDRVAFVFVLAAGGLRVRITDPNTGAIVDEGFHVQVLC